MHLKRNGFKDPAVQGTETYHHQDAAADSGSVKLAKLVQQEVVKATGYRDRGVKTAEFGVLTSIASPSGYCRLPGRSQFSYRPKERNGWQG